MARIAGVDLPQNKQVWIGLTYIYGIGRARSREILRKAEVDAVDQGQGPDRGRGAAHPQDHPGRGPGRGRPAQGGRPEHQAADGDRLLPRRPAPARSAGARPAHAHQRAHPQGSARGDGRQQEEADQEVATSQRGADAWRRQPAGIGEEGEEGAPRRRSKSVVPHGVAHIQATLQQHDRDDHRSGRQRPLAGPRRAASGSRARARARRSRPRSRRRAPATRPRSTACAPSTCRCADRAPDASRRSARCRPPASTSSRSGT